jgi:hypothetical protein
MVDCAYQKKREQFADCLGLFGSQRNWPPVQQTDFAAYMKAQILVLGDCG